MEMNRGDLCPICGRRIDQIGRTVSGNKYALHATDEMKYGRQSFDQCVLKSSGKPDKTNKPNGGSK